MKAYRDLDPSDFGSAMKGLTGAVSGVTAATASNQAGGYPITKAITRVTTAASAGDSLLLPAAKAGDTRIVFNKAAANSIDIFPNVGDNINALSDDAAYALAATKGVMFVCAVNGTWDTLLTA